MKAKKLLAIIAPAMLLASCGGGNKTTTTISKINLTNAKTLIMGKLSNSSVTTNDDEEQLITVDEEGNATETEVEVTTGNKTTETTNITISRLVKLNNEYAVVSCTYNEVTYDLIVNLTDGTCVKFPDSSLLPNSKEKMGGHKEYRRYKKQYGYLNNAVVQPNSEEKFFYYINCYQVDETTNQYARRLVMLDLESDPNKPSATALVTPVDDEGNKLSVQSFAVNNNGAVAYVTSNNIKITNPVTDLHDPKVFYNGEDHTIIINSKYDKISPVLITGEDGVIYCYLKVKDQTKYVAGTITLESENWLAEPIIEEGSSEPTEFESFPEKVFGVSSSSGTKLVTINNVNSTRTFNQLLSFGRKNFTSRFTSQNKHPGGIDNPTDRKTGKGSGPTKDIEIKDQTALALDDIIDGFSGNSSGYLFGSKNGTKGLRKIKYYDDGSYQYVKDILSSYLSNLSNEVVVEIETDDTTEDITVVVEDNDEETVYVVDGDTEKEVTEIEEVSDVVDVAA